MNPRTSRRSRWLWVFIPIIAIIGIIIIAIAGRFSSVITEPPSPLQVLAARSQEVVQGLDILQIEYPQASQGSEIAGAMGAFNRARNAFNGAHDDLAKV